MSKLNDVLLICKTRIQQNGEIGSGLIADAEAELAALRARIAALEAVQVAAVEAIETDAISIFLSHHKRLCPANKGQNCNCGLFEARRIMRKLAAALDAAKDASK